MDMIIHFRVSRVKHRFVLTFCSLLSIPLIT